MKQNVISVGLKKLIMKGRKYYKKNGKKFSQNRLLSTCLLNLILRWYWELMIKLTNSVACHGENMYKNKYNVNGVTSDDAKRDGITSQVHCNLMFIQ